MVLIPAKMGRINKRALLGRLRRIGQASRADLAKSLGLSQPTAGKIADELLKLGVLEEIEDESAAGRANGTSENHARVGRPGRMLRLSRNQPRFLAIQLGVTESNLCMVPVGVDPEDHWEAQVPTPTSAEEWVAQLGIAAAKFFHKDIWGVLISVPGIVDEPGARVLFSPNLHWTEAVSLPKLIQQVWPWPAALVQEERALALGHQSVDLKEEDFLLVDFGEGVGGAAIVSGKLYTSPLPLSGEIGHTPVLGNRRKCGCGAVGCLETLVSVRGLLQSFSCGSRVSERTWEAMIEAIESKGVPGWLAETLDAAAVIIAGALNVLGLRRVIITGTVAELPPAVMEYLSGSIVKGSMWARFGALDVESAPRRRTAGLVAVGIDRLVLPMESDPVMEAETAGNSPKIGGWLSYHE